MKKLIALFVLMTFGLLYNAQSQSLPDAPHSSKKLLALEAAMVGAASFDAYTTIRANQPQRVTCIGGVQCGDYRDSLKYYPCHEANPLIGKHPSTAHVVIFEAAWTAGELLVIYELHKHNHPKLAAVMAGESLVEHGIAGGLNTQTGCY